MQKQLERLNKAREEKERIKNFMERGVLPPKSTDAINVSTISAVSKRPTNTATINNNRKSPNDVN